jgi:hypothetical protein
MSRKDGLISRYEELRQQALGRPNGISRAQGLALLMRNGISGWVRAWAQCVAVPASRTERLVEDDILPLEMHREVTMILAEMVLNRRQEATA